MVAVPLGPTGIRGSEINMTMQGIFAGVKSKVIRDAAWEYMSYLSSKEAMKIHTAVMVKGGLGAFLNPKYLKKREKYLKKSQNL